MKAAKERVANLKQRNEQNNVRIRYIWIIYFIINAVNCVHLTLVMVNLGFPVSVYMLLKNSTKNFDVIKLKFTFRI